MLFAVDDAQALLLHEEPIYRDGDLVGRTTSGGRGFRTGLSREGCERLVRAAALRQRRGCRRGQGRLYAMRTVSMGYVDCARGETLRALLDGSYEIGLGRQRLPLRPLQRAPYDPDGVRMRG